MPARFASLAFLFTAVIGSLICLNSCKKDRMTLLKGRVTDRITGKPVAKAKFSLEISSGKGYVTEIFFTDGNGLYDHSLNEEVTSIAGYSTLAKEGYVTKTQLGLRAGKTNELDITMLPLDGTLKFTVKNASGDLRPLYLQVINPAIGQEGKQPPYHVDTKNQLVLAKDEERTYWYTLPESATYFYWDFQALNPVTSAAFQDSVSVLSKDTVGYQLIY